MVEYFDMGTVLVEKEKYSIEDFIERMEIPAEFLRSKVAVAMSGGVDSAVTAALLKLVGVDVVGIYMKNWSDPRDCQGDDDRGDALKVALSLKIPFEVVNLEKEYKEKVIDYFYDSYRRGLTPNPDVMCNKEIKFKVFFDRVRRWGTHVIATGHYALRRANGSSYQLLAGLDPTKDQSYFLYNLNQDRLSKAVFPLGNFYKSQVREIAKNLNIPVHSKKDSQGICFVGKVNIKEFLSRRLPKKEGLILDTKGKTLGNHDGAYFYTLGQREGLGIGGGIPYYVVDKNVKRNILVASKLNKEDKLFKKSLIAKNVNWISEKAPKLPLKVKARIRHLQPLQEVVIEQTGNDKLLVKFTQEQRAVSPGQSVVFYDGRAVLGGGVIGRYEYK